MNISNYISSYIEFKTPKLLLAHAQLARIRSTSLLGVFREFIQAIQGDCIFSFLKKDLFTYLKE